LGRLAPLLLAAGLTAIFYIFVLEALDNEYLTRVFSPSGGGVQVFVPVSITFLFLWTMAELAAKWNRVRLDRARLATSQIVELPSMIGKRGVEWAADFLADLPAHEKRDRVGRTIVAVVEQLRSTGEAERAQNTFRHQAELDADHMHREYTAVRLFIWAMPILGFIGTVIGISGAVGEFSGFLTGNIDDVGVIRNELSRIASGLAFAFDTTLLGLVGSLLAMLAASYVQTADESVHALLEQLSLTIVGQFREDGSRASGPAITVELDGRLLEVSQGCQALAGSVDALGQRCDRLADSVDGVHKRFGAAEQTFARLGNATEALVGQVVEVVRRQDAIDRANHAAENLGSQVIQLQQLHTESVAAVRAVADPLVKSLDALFVQIERLNRRHDVMDRATQAAENLASHVEELQHQHAESALAVRAAADPLVTSLDALLVQVESLNRRHDATDRATDVVENLASQVKDLKRLHVESLVTIQATAEPLVAALNSLLGQVESLNRRHDVTDQATKATAMLGEQVRELQELHTRSLAVVGQLSGPLEFRITPRAADPAGLGPSLSSGRNDGQPV
jgi:biopolymer transport protein ExbB/TolQ